MIPKSNKVYVFIQFPSSLCISLKEICRGAFSKDSLYNYVSSYSNFKSTVLHQFLELGGLSMHACIGFGRRMQHRSLRPRSTTFIFYHDTLSDSCFKESGIAKVEINFEKCENRSESCTHVAVTRTQRLQRE